VILERNKIKEDLRKNNKELEEYTEYVKVTERKSNVPQEPKCATNQFAGY